MSAGDSPALPRRPRRAAAWLARVAADNAPGAVYGTVMVGVLLAAGATVTTGVTVALWATAVRIVALEAAAAWRARLRRQDVWIQAGAGAVMGLAIIALKLVLH